MNIKTLACVSIASAVCGSAYAEDWQPVKGASSLQELVAGATAEIQLKPGVTAVGKYHADGTAKIEAWNETFRRTWRVKDDTQVCYTSEEAHTNCFSFEQSIENPAACRARNTATGEIIRFRIRDGRADVLERDQPPGEEGGLGAPSAAEIAAALSNPNTTLRPDYQVRFSVSPVVKLPW